MKRQGVTLPVIYPELKKLPKLPEAVGIYIVSGSNKHQGTTVPAGMLDAASISPENGLSVASYGDILLLWEGKNGTMLPWVPNQMVRISHTAVPRAIDKSNYCVVFGNGYLAFCTPERAKSMAPLVAAQTYRTPQKIENQHVVQSSEQLRGLTSSNYAWLDVRIQPVTRTIAIPEKAFILAGFKFGDTLTITRHEDGVEYSRCTDGSSTYELHARVGDGTRTPRMKAYAGNNCLDMSKIDTGRVIVTPGRIQVTDSKNPTFAGVSNANKMGKLERAALASDGTNRPATARLTQNTATYELKAHQTRLQIQGQWLSEYGFVPGARFDVEADPAFPRQITATLNPEGANTVTTLTGDTPKLYVSRADLSHIKTAFVRVNGKHGRLHLRSDVDKLKELAAAAGRKPVPARGRTKPRKTSAALHA